MIFLLTINAGIWAQDSLSYTDTIIAGDSFATAINSMRDAAQVVQQKDQEAAPLPAVERTFHTRTLGFYILLFILLSFGVFRQLDSGFFSRLFSSFMSTSGSIRFARAQVGQKSILSYWMNAMFFFVGSIYLYYVIYTLSPSFSIHDWSRPTIILVLSFGLIGVYLVKFLFLKMLGVLFNIEQFTDEYLFNVFLVNKVLAILLIPVIVLLMFAASAVAKVVAIASIVLVALALLNRYARSQETMRAMVKLNKFHFFIYLCTSEIIPIAILAKVVMMN